MNKRTDICHFYFLLIFAIGMAFFGCTSPFNPEIPPSNSVLVVEASITNEVKQHQIFLSRSTQNSDGPELEEGAEVTVMASNGQEYRFSESAVGIYTSTSAFSAQPNVSYQLMITRSNGSSYTSEEVVLPQTSQIERVYAERVTTETGLDGVQIFVDGFDPTGNSIYYKYEYEETYKIIVPNWVPDQLVVVSEENMVVGVVPRQEEERICFATNSSNSIIITQTSGAGEDRVSGFEVQFINRENFIISHRYSILVKQHVISREAFNFYEKLKDFSGSESLFSQSQPGFIDGNISSLSNEEERVVGIFEVSSVSEQRIFFNYTDLFPNEDLPAFVDECKRINISPQDPNLFNSVKSNSVSFVGTVTDPSTGALLEYVLVPKVCGDCTELGNAEVPSFWEE
ncbi:MAG: DUF4249 domain-containing protein [Flavobacteriaceae bacterium]